MRPFTCSVVILSLLSVRVGTADGQGADDVFDFFAEEARVMTASLQPTTLTDAPATVYVVTAEDIAASGGRTLWDALRGVPGVDVMSTRAWHGEVGIRGLNRPLNNRVLVLLDGKTVLNGFFDFVTWEAIPVTLADVDRIEVVLGPASALYGANAVNGVINIITGPSTDAQANEVSFAAGERSTRMVHVVYGGGGDGTQVQASASFRSGNQFEGDRSSSEVFKTHGAWVGELAGAGRARVSGGLAVHDTELATPGAAGAAYNDGGNGFLDAELDWRGTRVRGFWNRGRSTLRGFDRLKEPNTDYDTADLSLTRSMALSDANELVLGGSYRRNRMRSRAFGPEPLYQDLWAGYLEDLWRPRPGVSLTLSARADWHPQTGWAFSPRASLTLHVAPRHVVRVSTGTAFRNPTLTENHVNFTDRFAYDGSLGPDVAIESVEIRFSGNPDLASENLLFLEGSYTGLFGPVRASVAGFHYRLRDIISASGIEDIEIDLPDIRVTSSFANAGDLEAWGGEASLEVRLAPGLSSYANYSVLGFPSEIDAEFAAEEGGPPHKLNAGFRLQRRGWLAGLSAHWVAGTSWDSSPLPASPNGRVDSFHLLNAHLSYGLGDGWRGLRLGLDAFNLTDHRHAELLPVQPNGDPGQSGERLERRLVVSASLPL